jgi:hypothetical protein
VIGEWVVRSSMELLRLARTDPDLAWLQWAEMTKAGTPIHPDFHALILQPQEKRPVGRPILTLGQKLKRLIDGHKASEGKGVAREKRDTERCLREWRSMKDRLDATPIN